VKILFNDATELTVQKVYVDEAGALRIKTVSATQEELRVIFKNNVKTKKIIVLEREKTLAEYINYTKFDGIMLYNAGFLESVLYREGESPEEKLERLQEENEGLKEQVDFLTQCMLEMSEMVYQ
jgi:hypothetical protein